MVRSQQNRRKYIYPPLGLNAPIPVTLKIGSTFFNQFFDHFPPTFFPNFFLRLDAELLALPKYTIKSMALWLENNPRCTRYMVLLELCIYLRVAEKKNWYAALAESDNPKPLFF